jgi:hypothetical protein
MRLLIPAFLVMLAGCVPAGAPSGGSVAQPVAFGGAAFPQPLDGWTASEPATSPAGDGGTVVKRSYNDAAGRMVGVTWFLDSPARVASVTAQANLATGDSGPAIVLANGTQTIDVATDARTVLHLDGNAGLGAQMSYLAAILPAATRSP